MKNLERLDAKKVHLGIVFDEPGAMGKFVFAPEDGTVFLNECTVLLKDLQPDEELTYRFWVRCSAGCKAKVRVRLACLFCDG